MPLLSDDASDDDYSMSDVDDDAPPPRRSKAASVAKKAGYGDDSGDDDDSNGEYAAAPVPKKKAAAASSSKTGTKSAAAAAKPRKKATAAPAVASGVDDEDDAARPSLKPISTAPMRGDGKTVEQIYQKKSQLEHILIRPDTYVGSIEAQVSPMWVYDGGSTMTYRNITWVPGLFKIFDEILVNAADNKIRDPSMDRIEVNIDRENNRISVYNNGKGIPIEMHSVEKMYVPELIFGNLLTSSNYDDTERKVTGGRNGYGAKLCNIYSNEFIVETGDAEKKLKYRQVFQKNMSKANPPVIKTVAKSEDFTRITFSPDLARFGMTHLDDDTVALLSKRAYDLAGCVRDIKVYLNDTRLKISTFKQYIDMYITAPETESGGAPPPKPTVIYEKIGDRWEVAATASTDGMFHQISFVNSICTSKGGTHVTYIADQLITGLTALAKKRDKKCNFKPNVVRSQLSVFVNCLIENPTFDSQTKENMTLKAPRFGSKCILSDEFVKKVANGGGVLVNVLAYAKFKTDQELKKTDGKRSTRISGISKLDDANLAGSRHGSECTLILTEGDSAKTLAVSGLSVVGRNNYGVFPLRGKLLNVRDATSNQIKANAEITALKQIIGLQQGKEYDTTSKLRYGHVMIMTDQDHDGSHIKGLIINFIDHFWPSLLKVPGFLTEFITPIVRVTPKSGGRRSINFFTIPEYEQWKKENNDGKGWTIKYYKGLGTSTAQDAKDYFSNMDLHRKVFSTINDDDRLLIDMAFNKKKADERKEWLRQLELGTFIDHNMQEIPMKDFINKELILFSQADCMRSIPSVVDGMKPGHRKILFSCFKRHLKSEIKVAQLGGYVGEHSAYHHGEQSLFSTIVGMAQNFVGSNNLNILEPRGQFGTRLQGGKDAASARYIFTALNPLARVVFHPEDDALLDYLNDDGQDIEPKWYMPILPMILVNGSDGIGTGWSTSVPNYNPRDIAQNLLRLMSGEPCVPMEPWYRGFRGTIVPTEKKDQFRVTGTIEKTSDTTVEIKELPIKQWTQNYKEMLEEWITGSEDGKKKPFIEEFKEYHTDATVHFVVTLSEENMRVAEAEGLEKTFKISTTLNTTNLVCFDPEGRICKYESPEDVMKEFYHLRLKYYTLRKEAMLARLTNDWTRLDNRVRFILEIIDGKLRVQNRKRVELLADLRDRGYVPMPKAASKTSRAKADAASDGEDEDYGELAESGSPDANATGSYHYLLGMPIWSLTTEKVNQLKREREEKQTEIDWLMEKSPKQLWTTDLDTFLARWEGYEKNLAKLEAIVPKRSKSPIKSGAKGAAKPRKRVVKKKSSSDDEDDDDAIVDDDSDDDFKVAPTKASKPKAEPKPRVKKEPAVDKKSKAEGAKSGAPDSMAKFLEKMNASKNSEPVEEPDEFKFDETPPRKKVAVSPLAEKITKMKLAQSPPASADPPKKRALGGSKAVLAGKDKRPITSYFPKAAANDVEMKPATVVTNDIAVLSDGDDSSVPAPAATKKAPAKSAPAATKRSVAAAKKSSSPRKRTRAVSEDADDFESDRSEAPKPRATAKPRGKAATKKPAAAKPVSDSDGDGGAASPPARARPSRRAAATKPVSYAIDLGEDDEDARGGGSASEDDDDDAPRRRKPAAPAGRKGGRRVVDEDDDDDGSDGFRDDDDDDDGGDYDD